LRRFWHRLTGLYIDEVVTRAEGRVLDLGCGDGELLLRLRAQGLDAAGVESNPRYSPMHERRALSVFCGSLEDAAFPSSTFDTVILSQVVEHLPDPGRTLVEIRRILAPGGRVLIYCPNARGYLRRWFGKYWHGWHIPFHFYVFSADTIARLAAQAGFQVRRIDGVTPNDFFVASLKSLLYGRREGARAPDRGRFLDTKPFRLIVAPLFRVLDLLQRGREDCLKVELVR
jgi:SAM-dependent methyltransferase